MSYAAAKLSPDAKEYLTFDPGRPTVPTSVFETTANYFGHTHDKLLQDGHITEPPADIRALGVTVLASNVYGRLVKAIQDASFVPRSNMAILALQAIGGDLANPFFIDEASENDEVAGQYARKTKQSIALAGIVADKANRPLESAHYLSTLTPEIVTHAIRHGLDKALVEIGGLKLEQTEKPVPAHDTLVNADAFSDQDEKLKELAVMTPAAKAALDSFLTPAGTALAEEDLRHLAEDALTRAHLSKEALTRDSISSFDSHPLPSSPFPYVEGAPVDQIFMSTLNPLDWMKMVNSSRSVVDGQLGFALLTDPALREHVLSKLRA